MIFFELLRHFHAGQRRRRCRHVDDHIDAFVLVPFAGKRGGDIGFIEGIGGDQFDRLAEHGATEIIDRHFGRFDVSHSADVGIDR